MRTAIIFGLDGKLWDATGCSVDIWNRALVWEINRFDRQIRFEGMIGVKKNA